MFYSSGMTFAGALAGTIPAIMAPVGGAAEARLLSDSLPSSALYVTVSAPYYEVTAPIDGALNSALRDSTQFLGLI
jgi:hypothetical protein